jgi:hypothetical protein
MDPEYFEYSIADLILLAESASKTWRGKGAAPIFPGGADWLPYWVAQYDGRKHLFENEKKRRFATSWSPTEDAATMLRRFKFIFYELGLHEIASPLSDEDLGQSESDDEDPDGGASAEIITRGPRLPGDTANHNSRKINRESDRGDDR